MKKLILILGILIGLSIGVSSQYMDGKTRSETHKRVMKKTYERNLTNELVKYIETGDVTPLLDLVQEEDITFIGLSGGVYNPSQNKEYFVQFNLELTKNIMTIIIHQLVVCTK